MKVKYLILGSGIGGLAMAAALKEKGENDFMVLDKDKELPKNFHNGLHYLHSCDFGTPFPFEFKKIVLTEEIWDTRNNTFKRQASIPEMFEYSKKVMENIRHPSSIMDPGKRIEVWVPFSNNMDDLIQDYYNYIGNEHFLFDYEIIMLNLEIKIVLNNNASRPDIILMYDKIISTLPIHKFYKMCGIKCPYELKQKTLYITNYKTTNIVPNWLIALYMSDPKFPPYRITVLNNLISMESLKELTYEDEIIIKYLIGDLFDYELSSKTNYVWETGRIFGMTKQEREIMVAEFIKKDIYLLGRFARWDGKLLIDSTICQAKEIASLL